MSRLTPAMDRIGEKTLRLGRNLCSPGSSVLSTLYRGPHRESHSGQVL